MEIKFIETDKTLRIEKYCLKERRISKILLFISYLLYYINMKIFNEKVDGLVILGIIIVYFFYNINYTYELIYIDQTIIGLDGGYFKKKILNPTFKRKYRREEIKLVYAWIYPEPRYKSGGKIKNNYQYRVHFNFIGENDYDCWGLKIPMDDAIQVCKKIIEFLEKNNKI